VVLGAQHSRNWVRRFKYVWRLWGCRGARQAFVEQLHRWPHWHGLFRTDPALYYVPVRSFLDSRWGAEERFGVLESDLRAANGCFGALAGPLAQGEWVTLARVPGYRVDLSRNVISPHEGLWALTLRSDQGQGIFNLSFSFTSSRSVLIGSVQGLSSRHADVLGDIQTLTRQCHGLRPPHLLVAVLKMAAQAWAVADIRGIDPDHQVKRHRNAQRQGFLFDYRSLWSECAGQRLESGHWHLDHGWQSRDPCTAPAKKRAMYRRRQEMLDALHQAVTQAVNPPVTRPQTP
jgi:uncharacterized protein VirK/YbjX